MGAPAQVDVGRRDQRRAAVQAVQVQEAAVPLRCPRQEPVLPVVRQRDLQAQLVSLIPGLAEQLGFCGVEETFCRGKLMPPPGSGALTHRCIW